MDNKTYYEARWKVWITKHIIKLGENMDNKTYYEARWKVWITKHIMKLGKHNG